MQAVEEVEAGGPHAVAAEVVLLLHHHDVIGTGLLLHPRQLQVVEEGEGLLLEVQLHGVHLQVFQVDPHVQVGPEVHVGAKHEARGRAMENQLLKSERESERKPGELVDASATNDDEGEVRFARSSLGWGGRVVSSGQAKAAEQRLLPGKDCSSSAFSSSSHEGWCKKPVLLCRYVVVRIRLRARSSLLWRHVDELARLGWVAEADRL